MSYEFITVHTEADKVGVITLNRPKQLQRAQRRFDD